MGNNGLCLEISLSPQGSVTDFEISQERGKIILCSYSQCYIYVEFVICKDRAFLYDNLDNLLKEEVEI